MSRAYACIISDDAKRDEQILLAVAGEFSYAVQRMDDGVLFDIRGLEKLVGGPKEIARRIVAKLKENDLECRVAVADTTETAVLLARENRSTDRAAFPSDIGHLPLDDLEIDGDALGVLYDLGIGSVRDLLQIPREDLVRRYGQEIAKVLDVVTRKKARPLAPNVRETSAAWKYDLDFPVDDFEQLIFVVNRGLDNLLGHAAHDALSTEQLDITFKLRDKTEKKYEIKTSFPTLEKNFWLKLINLRIALAPPESEIMSVRVVAHFTRPRPDQRGLYAVSRPEPESLLLTLNKIRKLVGEENVGVPVLVDERSARPFSLDPEAMPKGKERIEVRSEHSVVALSYFEPPVAADVWIKDNRLSFLKTQHFGGRVVEYSGVWRAGSMWWDKRWSLEEWDVEVENHGVYRLAKTESEWLITGEYD
jgi:protein ImuB